MAINICFTFILLYILSSISIEDINTMIISENKLILFTISEYNKPKEDLVGSTE